MSPIKKAVVCVGGVSAAARLCGVSSRAINKWVAAGRLPRTEFTGETRHAENLASGAEGEFTAESLLAASASAFRQSVHGDDLTGSRTGRSASEVPVQISSSVQVSL